MIYPQVFVGFGNDSIGATVEAHLPMTNIKDSEHVLKKHVTKHPGAIRTAVTDSRETLARQRMYKRLVYEILWLDREGHALDDDA